MWALVCVRYILQIVDNEGVSDQLCQEHISPAQQGNDRLTRARCGGPLHILMHDHTWEASRGILYSRTFLQGFNFGNFCGCPLSVKIVCHICMAGSDPPKLHPQIISVVQF